MATTVKVMSEQKRARYSAEYRAEALSLAEQVGVAAAARKPGLYATQIYQWRSKAAHERSISDRERELSEENARLKRQLATAWGSPLTCLTRTSALSALIRSGPVTSPTSAPHRAGCIWQWSSIFAPTR